MPSLWPAQVGRQGRSVQCTALLARLQRRLVALCCGAAPTGSTHANHLQCSRMSCCAPQICLYCLSARAHAPDSEASPSLPREAAATPAHEARVGHVRGLRPICSLIQLPLGPTGAFLTNRGEEQSLVTQQRPRAGRRRCRWCARLACSAWGASYARPHAQGGVFQLLARRQRAPRCPGRRGSCHYTARRLRPLAVLPHAWACQQPNSAQQRPNRLLIAGSTVRLPPLRLSRRPPLAAAGATMSRKSAAALALLALCLALPAICRCVFCNGVSSCHACLAMCA